MHVQHLTSDPPPPPPKQKKKPMLQGFRQLLAAHPSEGTHEAEDADADVTVLVMAAARHPLEDGTSGADGRHPPLSAEKAQSLAEHRLDQVCAGHSSPQVQPQRSMHPMLLVDVRLGSGAGRITPTVTWFTVQRGLEGGRH